MEEIEVKFLDVDVIDVEKKIVTLKGKKVFDRVFKRKLFDWPDNRLENNNEWLRIRDEGDKITFTYKKMTSGERTEEFETEVKDFNTIAEILTRSGLIEKRYVETRRVRYMLGEVEIDIDSFPLIKPYLEIEANSWEELNSTVQLLDLDPKDQKIIGPKEVYAHYGINDSDYLILTFAKQVKKSS